MHRGVEQSSTRKRGSQENLQHTLARQNLKPWSEVIKECRMKWYGHLLRLNEKTPARLALKKAERKVKKPKGSQKLTWMKLIGKDLEEYKIPRCKTAWRNLISCGMSAHADVNCS